MHGTASDPHWAELAMPVVAMLLWCLCQGVPLTSFKKVLCVVCACLPLIFCCLYLHLHVQPCNEHPLMERVEWSFHWCFKQHFVNLFLCCMWQLVLNSMCALDLWSKVCHILAGLVLLVSVCVDLHSCFPKVTTHVAM